MKFHTSYICLTLLMFNCSFHDKDINISISDSEIYYRFEATFPKNRTDAVQSFINKSIQPNSLFSSTADVLDVTTTLQDGTKFQIKASPGKVKIKLKKSENSEASYQRIKAIGEEIKEVLR